MVTEMKVSVTSGKAAHAVHTVFLSIPHVDDVTSHLVNEWEKKSLRVSRSKLLSDGVN